MDLKLNIEAEGQPFIVPISAEYTAQIEEQINKALNHFLGTIAHKIDSILTDLVFVAIGIRKDHHRTEIVNDSLISKLLKDKATELVSKLDLQAECVLPDFIRAAIRQQFIGEVCNGVKQNIHSAAYKRTDILLAQLMSENIKFSPVTSVPRSDEYSDPKFGDTEVDALRIEELAKVISVEFKESH